MIRRRGAEWFAKREALPTALRAVLGYYADTGVFDHRSLALKREIDDRTDRMVADVFERVEAALEAEFDRESVSFAYDTKLVLPAELALGYVYRHARRRSVSDPVRADVATGVPGIDRSALSGGASPRLSPRESVVRAEQMTRLAIEALLDGDMRDARNDGEFEDFAVDVDADPRRVAQVAQSTLEAHLNETLAGLPDVVGETYGWAVEYSEAHQERDEHFRELLAAADTGDEAALARIDAEYRSAPFEETPDIFAADELDLPYLRTQYARVGVLYDAMVGLYRLAGLSIDDDFARAIVFAIIGAQVWLDDVEDYADDLADGQLTPVTAEYLLAPDEEAAYENVLAVTDQYLGLAREYATRADSPLTGIAVEYIYRSGDPRGLPGGPT